MLITKQLVADAFIAYLSHRISLPELVAWSEDAIMEGSFEESNMDLLTDVVAKIGLADTKAFGLRWEDCEALLYSLGYRANLSFAAA